MNAKSPFRNHGIVLRAAIREADDWRGGGMPEDYPNYDKLKANRLLALEQLIQAANRCHGLLTVLRDMEEANSAGYDLPWGTVRAALAMVQP